MVKKANLIKATKRDSITGGTRSPKWSKVEHEYLRLNPVCESCSATTHLNVHHIQPFHLHPELELEPSNLMTLCMENDCHLLIGHGGNFKAFNPNVREDAEYINSHNDKKQALLEIAPKVKNNRLLG